MMEYFKETDNLEELFLFNTPINLFYRYEIINEAVTWFKSHNYKIYNLDAKTWTSENVFHENVSEVLKFPEYYGNNLNAFNDCISDFILSEDNKNIIVIENYDVFEKLNKSTSYEILDILAINSRKCLIYGGKFIILIHSNNPSINFESVGAVPVMWNNLEWSNKSRGL